MSSSDRAAPRASLDTEEEAPSTSRSDGQDNNDEPPAAKTFCGYLRSYDFREFLASLIFLGLCLIVYVAEPVYNERPIPYQLLENSGDYVRNLVNNETFTGDSIPNDWLIVLGIILPIVVQVILSWCWGKVGDIHRTACVYMIALGITLLVTELLKLYVGYLRPVFYYFCQPDQNYQECTGADYSANANKSFPSGHASTSFTGLTVLTLYLHARFGIPSIRVYKQEDVGDGFRYGVRYVKTPILYRFISIFSLLPMGLATFIAASRIHDNKHFPADVVGGSVLGTAVAIFTNGLWFD